VKELSTDFMGDEVYSIVCPCQRVRQGSGVYPCEDSMYLSYLSPLQHSIQHHRGPGNTLGKQSCAFPNSEHRLRFVPRSE